MAAKISAELKARVKALRDECKVFIDLRSSTEQECLAYIAKHEPKPVEPEQAPQYLSCDIVDSAFHQMQALQLNIDLNTYSEWQKSVFEDCKDSFYEWHEKQAASIEVTQELVLPRKWALTEIMPKPLPEVTPRNLAHEFVEEAKQTDVYWQSWNEAYQSAVETLTAPVHKELEIEDYAHLFTFADLSSLVTDAVNAISKNLVKALRSIWGAVPQQYRALGKAFLQRRKDEIFSRCNSFKEMVKASKLIGKLGA